MQTNNKGRIAKKILSYAVASTLVFTSMTPANASLQDAINNIATSHGGMGTALDPHTFRTSTQRGFHAGSVNMRFPVKAINLVSVERASVNVGCNGVSITFGGMAFISADEIIEYLKTIAKGVPALIYSMVLKAIAAPLEASLNKLYATMERLSASLKNSCEASQALVGMMGNIDMGGGETASDVFGGMASGIGATGAKAVDGVAAGLNAGLDFGEKGKSWLSGLMDGGVKGVDPKAELKVKECMQLAREYGVTDNIEKTDICEPGGSFVSSYKQLQTIAAKTGVPEKDVWLKMANRNGNVTWNALQAYGVAPDGSDHARANNDEFSKSIQGNLMFANLMLSMLGFDLKKEGEETIKRPPTISGQDVISLFMCGKPQAIRSMAGSIPKEVAKQGTKERLVSWCEDKLAKAGEKVFYQCPSELFDLQNGNCLNPTTPLLDSFDHSFIGTTSSGGILFYIADLMDSSVQKAAAGGTDTKFDPPEQKLMALSPVPIYEVYNIAAATPTVAAQLLEANALLISYGVVNAMLTEMIASVVTPKHDNINSIFTSLPNEIHKIMFDMQDEIAVSYAQEVKYVDFYKQRIENIMATIKSINKNVLEGSMAMGLDGQSFVEGLSKMSGR